MNKGNNIQAIIIDDNNSVLFLHELMIEESGFANDIQSFMKADEALDFLKRRPSNGKPCIVFLDINMPGMDGWDFLKEIDQLKINSNLQVVMVTSSINKSDRQKAFLFEKVVHFVEKPLTLEDCEYLMKLDKLKSMFS